jgi:hypothetical protein
VVVKKSKNTTTPGNARKSPKNFVTLMVVPHHSASNIIKIKLPEWGAKTLVAVGGVLALAILVFFLYSSRLTLKMIHYYGLLSENRRQEKQIEYFLNETDKLRKGVEDLESRDQELREMLGMRKRKGQVEPAPEIKDDGRSQISKTFNNLAWIKDSLKDGRESFMEVAQEANQKSLVFAKLLPPGRFLEKSAPSLACATIPFWVGCSCTVVSTFPFGKVRLCAEQPTAL